MSYDLDQFIADCRATMKRIVEVGLQRHTHPGRAEAVRQHAAQFDWDRTAAQYLALYARLLQLPPG